MNSNTSHKKLTAVVVGTGFIGPVHVEAMRRSGVHVAGIVGSSPEKSIAAAEELGLDRGYASFDEVLHDGAVDVVHLATPNQLHFAQASAVLKAGKHVMCEKPLAMNSDESAELVKFAKSSGLVAGVAYNVRFYPLCREAAQRVSTKSIGEVFHVNGSYIQDWLLKSTDFNWRVEAEAGGELRAIADIGTHWLDLIQFVLGQKIVAVCADLQTVHPQRSKPIGGAETFSGASDRPNEVETVEINTEDAGSVMLKFENGARGSLYVSQTTAGRKNCLRFEIAGSDQSLAWISESPNSLWIGNRDRPNESLIRDPANLSDFAGRYSNYPGGHNEGFPDTFKQMFLAFYGYISAGDYSAEPTFATFDDGHREILLCESILTSHRNQSWVNVKE